MNKFASRFLISRISSNAVLHVTMANLFSSLVGIVSGVLTAKWLLPKELGEFSALSIFTSYIVISQIGIPSGLSRDLPFLFGQGNNQEAEEIASTAKYFLLRLSQTVLLISIVVSIFFFMENRYQYALGAFVVGVTSFQNLFVTKYLKVLYRSNNHFRKLSHITSINSLVTAVSIVLVYHYAFYGLCLRAILMAVIDWYFTNKWKPLNIKAQWSSSRFKKLLMTGLPIYSISSIYGLWPTIQRTMILSVIGATGLGLFALANIVQNMLGILERSISSVIFPQMSTAFGRGASIRSLLRIPLKFIVLIFFFNAIVLAAGWSFLPIVIAELLPNYVNGIEAAQWMLVVSLISPLHVFSNLYMVIKKNQLRLVSYLVGVLAWYLFIQLSSIENLSDIVIFCKGLVAGYILIVISDLIIITALVKRDERESLKV